MSGISNVSPTESTPAQDFLREVGHHTYGTILADPPWQFTNRTGKMAPEHRRLTRYTTLTFQAIKDIPVAVVAAEQSHLYLWVPNALLREGLEVLAAWGFQYKTNIIWHKIRKDGGPDGRGVGFYFRNTTEMVLFGVRGRLRTLAPGRTQVNVIKTRKREHSRKPDELYGLVEACSPGPFLELFARGQRVGWEQWGNEVVEYAPSWPTYAHHSQQNVLPFDLHRRKHG
jgi:N6-adenosine-specific RNA methylase IME4